MEQALRAGMLQLIGHAVPPSLSGAHPKFVKIENAWMEQVMAYTQGSRKEFPMPPSWLVGSAILPEASTLAAAAMEIVGAHTARTEAPKPVEAPVAEKPTPSESKGTTTPSESKGAPGPSAGEGKE